MQYSIPGLIYDAVFLCLLAAVAYSGMRRGFLSSMLGLGSVVAGIVLGTWATHRWAAALYTDHLGVAIGEALADTLADYGNDLGAALEQLTFLPQPLRQALADRLDLTGLAGDVVPRLVAALEPVLLPLLQALLFLVVCLAVRGTVRLLARLLRGVNALPLLGDFNKILGFAFGFVTGILECWLLAMALWLLSGCLAERLPFLAPELLQQSTAYRLLAGFNPFAA